MNRKASTQKITERERKALLENLRSELSVPLEVIFGYCEILTDELARIGLRDPSKSKEIGKFGKDLKRIVEESKAIQKQVDKIFQLAVIVTKQSSFDLAEFIRTLRHALITPLSSIIGYCELLWEDGISSCGKQVDSDLRKIYEAAQFFIDYIDKISVVAQTQLEGGDLLEHFKNLSAIIHNVVVSIPPLRKKIKLQPAKKGSVLIVDDNQMELDLLQRRIEFDGYEAVPCDHGSKVIEMLQKGSFDLVLLQIVMADINGFEVLKQIKKSAAFPHLPIIVLSPFKELDAVVRCFELGADDYLQKPFHSVIFKARVSDCIDKKKLTDREQEHFLNLENEKKKSEELLLSILPVVIAERLKRGEEFIADRIEEASIIFIDIVNSSGLSEKLSAQELILLLNQVFSMIDRLLDQYQVEKIKTMGDSYMAAAGVPIPNKNHAEAIANFALKILEGLKKINKEQGCELQIRIGIHSGPVVAGIIGEKKFNYDLWGKTVNLASRMESQGVPDKIQVSEANYKLLKNKYDFIPRGEIEARGIGKISTYFLVGPKA